MRIDICAIGRLRAGAEKDLIDDYLARADKSGRNLGLGPNSVIELDPRKGGMAQEAKLIRKSLPPGAQVIALDERGKQMDSVQFAQLLTRLRDDGTRNLAFVIGGADGLEPQLRNEADHVLSLSKMVWPHMLVRVMIAEQIYRATTILAGRPYHRN